MKYIPLTVRPHTDKDIFPATVTDKDVIRQIAAFPDQNQGLSLDMMRQGIKVLDALDAADDMLVLETAQWDYLCARTKAFPWGAADRRFVALADAILEASETDPRVQTTKEVDR